MTAQKEHLVDLHDRCDMKTDERVTVKDSYCNRKTPNPKMTVTGIHMDESSCHSEGLSIANLKPKVKFDDTKWAKICRMAQNISLTNVKQFIRENGTQNSSSMMPGVLSENVKYDGDLNVETSTKLLGEDTTKSTFHPFDLNILEFIVLACTAKNMKSILSFKIVEDSLALSKYHQEHPKAKFKGGLPPNKIPGTHGMYKQPFKIDQRSTISSMAKDAFMSPRAKPLRISNFSCNEKRGKPTERLSNHSLKVGYKNRNEGLWKDPKDYEGSGVFSFGSIKGDTTETQEVGRKSATAALVHLSHLFQDFQIATKGCKNDDYDGDVTTFKTHKMDNFTLFDESVDDSLKSSQFSKFFKALRDQQNSGSKLGYTEEASETTLDNKSREKANKLLKLMLMKRP